MEVLPALADGISSAVYSSPGPLLSDAGAASDAIGLGAGIAGFLAGVAGYRFYLYTQLEYITAAMLTNNVPKGGANVLQMGGGTRELYYYPKDINRLVNVGEKANKSLIEQGGVQAGVPVIVKNLPATSMDFQGDSTVDAIVSLHALAPLSAPQRSAFFEEAIRVLKPGQPVIFIERLREGGSPLRFLIGNSQPELELQALQDMQQLPGFDLVRWDVALEGQDPHAVGVALRTDDTDYKPGSAKRAAASATKKAAAKRALEKGFGKS